MKEKDRRKKGLAFACIAAAVAKEEEVSSDWREQHQQPGSYGTATNRFRELGSQSHGDQRQLNAAAV